MKQQRSTPFTVPLADIPQARIDGFEGIPEGFHGLWFEYDEHESQA